MVSAVLHPSAFQASDSPDSMRDISTPREGSVEEILASIRRIIADDQQNGELSEPMSLMVPPQSTSPGRSQSSPVTSAYLRDRHKVKNGAGAVLAKPVTFASVYEQHKDIQDELEAVVDLENDDSSLNSNGLQAEVRSLDREAQEAPTQLLTPQGRKMDAQENLPSTDEMDMINSTKHSINAMLSSEVQAHVGSSLQSLTAVLLAQNSGFVERQMQEMLRPMLQEWLNTNLPPLVERIVATEIERIVRSMTGGDPVLQK